MEGEREREGLGGRERGEAMMMLSAQTGLARYQSRDVPPRRYKSRPGITTYSIQILCRTAFLFQVAYPGNKIINYNNHTAQGENNEHNSRPCSPITHIPHVFLPNPYLIPTQPEPDPSLAYVAAYMPYTHSLHIKNSDPFKWYPVVLHRWRCTAWFVQNPVAAQKEKHLRDGIMVENQLEHAYTYTHIRNVPDVRPRSTRDNVRCTANQPAVRQGERAEGPSWLCVDVIWAQRHALAVILGYCSIIQGKYAWRK